MNDIDLLKEIDELLDDEAKDILANIQELGQLQKVHTLLAVGHMRAERVNEIRRRMLAYSKMRLQEVIKGEA